MSRYLLRGCFGAVLICFSSGCSRTPTNCRPAPDSKAESKQRDPAADTQSDSKQDTQVPQLTGVPREWAMQLLSLKQIQGVGGRLYLPPTEWRSEWADGQVLLQTPQATTVIRQNATVAFWTLHRAAKDDALAEVPNVIAKTEAQAKSELEAAGFTVMTVRRKPSEKEDKTPDKVLDQFPRAAGPWTVIDRSAACGENLGGICNRLRGLCEGFPGSIHLFAYMWRRC